MPSRIDIRLNLTPRRTSFMAAVLFAGVSGFSSASAQGAADYRCPVDAPAPVVAVAQGRAIPPPPGPQAVAQASDYQSAGHTGFPRWGDFPPPPQNVPRAEDIRLRVVDLKGIRDSYLASVRQLTWDMTDPEIFRTQTLARIDQSKMTPIDTQTCEQILEFARQQQKLATPPPVADN